MHDFNLQQVRKKALKAPKMESKDGRTLRRLTHAEPSHKIKASHKSVKTRLSISFSMHFTATVYTTTPGGCMERRRPREGEIVEAREG